MSPALTGGFSSTAPLGKSPYHYFFKSRGLKKSEIIILSIHSNSGRMNEVTPGREGDSLFVDCHLGLSALIVL